MDESKREVREQMRTLRAGLDARERAQADAQIAAQVIAHPAYRAAQTVFTYLSVGDEVDTRAIIRDAWAAGKTVAIPRVVPGTRTMQWFAIESFDALETSSFGVQEPPADPARMVESSDGEGESTLALVPGFTFDAEGYRIGYGGGFYDVFLSAFGGVSLGLCRRTQYSAHPLPRDAHDRAVDEVILG